MKYNIIKLVRNKADEYSASVSATFDNLESTTGSRGSGTFIDMRPRRLNSIVWRRIA